MCVQHVVFKENDFTLAQLGKGGAGPIAAFSLFLFPNSDLQNCEVILYSKQQFSYRIGHQI